MDKLRVSLLESARSTLMAVKNVGHASQAACILSLAFLPTTLYADSGQSRSQTYVIPTYGSDALLPAVRQQLSTSRDGGTVVLTKASWYYKRRPPIIKRYSSYWHKSTVSRKP